MLSIGNGDFVDLAQSPHFANRHGRATCWSGASRLAIPSTKGRQYGRLAPLCAGLRPHVIREGVLDSCQRRVGVLPIDDHIHSHFAGVDHFQVDACF